MKMTDRRRLPGSPVRALVMGELVFDLPSTKETRAILKLVHAEMDHRNHVYIHPAALAKETGLHRSNLSVARRRLVECKFMVQIGLNQFLVNPEFIRHFDCYGKLLKRVCVEWLNCHAEGKPNPTHGQGPEEAFMSMEDYTGSLEP